MLVALGVVAASSVSGGASAAAPEPARPLPCNPAKQVLDSHWQAFTAGDFPAVPGATGAGRITSYAVDRTTPTRVLISDGVSIRFSDTSGCGFRTVLTLPGTPDGSIPISGSTAKVVSLSFVGHAAIAVVKDGNDPLARPHVIVSPTAESGTWSLGDSGLPLVGTPDLLRVAGDGNTVYLSVTAPKPGGITLPGAVAPAPLYRSSDRGKTWTAASAPSPLIQAVSLTAFAVDPGDPKALWGVIDGQLNRSTDAGSTFTPLASIDTSEASYNFILLDAFAPKSVVAFSSASDHGPLVLVTHDNGKTFRTQPSPGDVLSAATRGTAPRTELVAIANATGPRLVEYTIDGGGFRDITPTFTKSATSALGDLSAAATFHAHSDTQVLRYLDTQDRGQSVVDDPTFVNGVLAAPKPGRVVPSLRTLKVKVGSSATSEYSLRLPPNPSPLDVFLAIDTSKSMVDVIGNLQAGLEGVAGELRRRGVNIAIGLGAIGTSPCAGQLPDPGTDPTVKGYKRPSPFTRLRAIGPVDQSLSDAIDSLSLETQPSTNGCDRPEGQLVALDQLANGEGVRDPGLLGAPVYVVAPGQVAGWRQGTAARRIVIVATDGSFGKAQGVPTLPNGDLDFTDVANRLREQRASVIGLSSGDPDATHDESRIARLTGGITPPSGINCYDADVPKLKLGDPVVCGTHLSISEAVLSALGALSGSDSIGVKVKDPAGVVTAVDHSAMDSVNLFDASATRLALTVACTEAGTFPVSVSTTLRGVTVGTTSLSVVCSGPPKPVVVIPPVLPAPQPPQIAAAPAPPVPPANPPGQVVNAQANPAAASQRQEEVQVALADQDSAPDEDVAPAGVVPDEDRPMRQLAMSAHSNDSTDAMYALGGIGLVSALGAAGAIGLRTRIRTRIAPSRAD